MVRLIIMFLKKEMVRCGVDFGLSDKEILDKLQIKLNISLQMAQEYFSKYGK